MADMRDYLELRGDIRLFERPFNDVDNLVLSTLAYLDLTGIVGGEGAAGEKPVAADGAVLAGEKRGITVAEACSELLRRADGDLSPYVRSLASVDERFVRTLGASARFGTARLVDYVDVHDDERALQFSAVTVELDAGVPAGAGQAGERAVPESYVAFRGTDTTLVGWRENFILSFAVTEAQREAASYLERALARAAAAGRRVRVGGHSKGGNLAAYATAVCPEALRGRIERVYSNDGPGMDPAVVPVRCADVMGERYTRILPRYSVVGRTFSDDAPCTIVESSAARTLQHDPLSWQVRTDGFVTADSFDPECLVVGRAFASWLEKLDPADRKLATNELFDALEAGGATSFEDVFSSVGAAQKVLSALGGIDSRAAEMMRGLVSELVATSAAATRDAVAEAVTDAATEVAVRAREALAGLISGGAAPDAPQDSVPKKNLTRGGSFQRPS